MSKLDIKTINLDNGINLHLVPTDKFKTIYISYCFHRDLDEDYSYNALVPLVLRRGFEGFENQKAISRHLEENYGSYFGTSVQKRGERQIIRFNFDIINEKYVEKEGLLEEAFNFMSRAMLRPILEEGRFKREYVHQEKENQKNKILAMINNKMQYSMERTIQEMCKDEKYSRYIIGDIDELNSLDEDRLFKTYKDILETSPLDIFVVGDVNIDETIKMVKSSLAFKRTKIKDVPEASQGPLREEVNTIIEEMDLAQAKLNLGFRTKISGKDEDYFALLLYSSILGGGPHSKLFNNVREKNSLAYYAFSRLEKYKSLMFIGSGIDAKDYEKALNIILEQMEDIKAGNISHKEFDASLKSLLTSLEGITDDQEDIVNYYLGNIISDTDYSPEDYMEKLKGLSIDDVIKVSKDIGLDTVYLLKPREGGEAK